MDIIESILLFFYCFTFRSFLFNKYANRNFVAIGIYIYIYIIWHMFLFVYIIKSYSGKIFNEFFVNEKLEYSEHGTNVTSDFSAERHK